VSRFRSQLPGPRFQLNMADAKQSCGDSKLQNLHARSSCLLVKMAVQLFFKSVAASQIASLLLLLYSMELSFFYMFAASLLLFSVLWCMCATRTSAAPITAGIDYC